jgi:hypothetical protein
MNINIMYPTPTSFGPLCGTFQGANIYEYVDCTDGQRYYYSGVLASEETIADVNGSEIVFDPGIIYKPER